MEAKAQALEKQNAEQEKRRDEAYQALYAFRLSFDFKNGEGVLGYLKGKKFQLDEDEIWFVKDFR